MIIFVIIELQKFNFLNTHVLEKIIKFWSIIFLIVTLDIIFELIFGFNSIGFVSEYPGRIASFFGDELIVGSFYHFFGLIFIGYLLNKKYPQHLILIIGILIILISFMIGERANFLRMFISIFLILFLLLKINFFKKLISILVIMIIIIFTISVNDNLKIRYYSQLKSIYTLNGIEKYFKKSQYGAHQNTAFQIFKNHKLFGVGMKNFRDESKKEIYENTEYKKNDIRQATHPHQIHLELLSETGLIGYLSFFILILFSIYFSLKNYIKNRDPIQLSTIIFLFTSLFPLLPSGSIFSTYYGGIFWFNYALMLSFNRKFKS
ncbi:O-antigen ligase family protein [Candidatus Pelagibacter sp.]|uniref:O-antigen ligase family protein n=1 Tax=Candidatus Pelagibacter sp. TaxID=2024849 RepID=UPI003F85C48A